MKVADNTIDAETKFVLLQTCHYIEYTEFFKKYQLNNISKY